jgi:hypothetical protein
MSDQAGQPDLQQLAGRLAALAGVPTDRALRVLEEVLSFLDETPEAFVRRRHQQLQREGLSNSEIYARLQAELSVLRFRAPAFSERQIRRLIYG